MPVRLIVFDAFMIALVLIAYPWTVRTIANGGQS